MCASCWNVASCYGVSTFDFIPCSFHPNFFMVPPLLKCLKTQPRTQVLGQLHVGPYVPSAGKWDGEIQQTNSSSLKPPTGWYSENIVNTFFQAGLFLQFEENHLESVSFTTKLYRWFETDSLGDLPAETAWDPLDIYIYNLPDGYPSSKFPPSSHRFQSPLGMAWDSLIWCWDVKV